MSEEKLLRAALQRIVDNRANKNWGKRECCDEAEHALSRFDGKIPPPGHRRELDCEELAKCFEADQLRGYSPIRNFTSEERRVIASALRVIDDHRQLQDGQTCPCSGSVGNGEG